MDCVGYQMMSSEQVFPLKDVWLRPRRVFRALSTRPVGIVDYVLAAAQGIAAAITVFRTPIGGVRATAADILSNSLTLGPFGGIISIFIFSALYSRLGKRAGGASTRSQVFHVLAYGGVPIVASLLLWALTAVLVGDAAFTDAPGADADGFVVLLLHVQFAAYVLLLLWSVILQVMGFSEIQGLVTRKAFVIWVLGQLIAFLAVIFLSLVLGSLFPSLVTGAAGS